MGSEMCIRDSPLHEQLVGLVCRNKSLRVPLGPVGVPPLGRSFPRRPDGGLGSIGFESENRTFTRHVLLLPDRSPGRQGHELQTFQVAGLAEDLVQVPFSNYPWIGFYGVQCTTAAGNDRQASQQHCRSHQEFSIKRIVRDTGNRCRTGLPPTLRGTLEEPV